MIKFFNQVNDTEFELILSGVVGWDFTGKEIADEIRYINSIGATKIIERINGPGGDVLDAFDIVDANINSEIPIETIITGLAASSLGWIAASGTKGHRFIVDYGKGMIHDPSVFGRSLEELQEGKDKEALKAIKDSIVVILSNMSGKTKDEISQMMTAETWIYPDNWVSDGFADEVIETATQPNIIDNMSIVDMVNVCQNFAYKKVKSNNQINMKEVTNHLQLQEGADSSKVLNAVKAIEVDRDTFKAENEAHKVELQTLKDEKTALETEKTDLTEKLAGFENATKEANIAKVEAIIDNAIGVKKIKANEKQTFVNLFLEDFDNAQKVIDSINLPVANIADLIDGENTNIPAERKEWTFRQWEKEDPTALNELKENTPLLYKELYKNEYGTDIKED